MTTIVYKDGVMAADSRAYSGGAEGMGEKVKIRRLSDESLIGCSTIIPGLSEAMIDWIESDMKGDTPNRKDKAFSAIMVSPEGKVYMMSNESLIAGPLKADFFATGTGADYAKGAMMMGASAKQAVKIAKRLDVWSDGKVRTLRLKT